MKFHLLFWACLINCNYSSLRGGHPFFWWGKKDILMEGMDIKTTYPDLDINLFTAILNFIKIIFVWLCNEDSYDRIFYYSALENCEEIVFWQLVSSLRKYIYLYHLPAASSKFCDLSILVWNDPVFISYSYANSFL